MASTSPSPATSSELEPKKFAYGNPFVEKVEGLMHFFSKNPPDKELADECAMLCMTGVPAFFTCRELINFVLPMGNNITQMRIVRDETPNLYMELAWAFYEQYNNLEFNSIEADRCTLLFVKKLELGSEAAQENIPSDALAELPICSVCLERMDDSIFTILCNHTFHSECLAKWSDTTCPVCRHTQTPELSPDQACSDCGKTTDLWMCLICGNVGCGRYVNAHAHQHYEATSHIFTLQVGGKLVWDYASDNFVHRLIQDTTEGKMVEHQGNSFDDRKENETLDAIQLEYTCLLTSQLENQRTYYEEKMRTQAETYAETEKIARTKIAAMEVELRKKNAECAALKQELEQTNLAKLQAEKKQQQTQKKFLESSKNLEQEKQMTNMILKDKDLLSRQRDELEKLRMKEIAALEDQLQDLMRHFDAQSKFQDEVKTANVSQQELEEGHLGVKLGESSSSAQRKSNRKKKNGG
ncbi:zn-finger in ubiquitin-hydrolases [Ditylenchus destructor]|nr:zn-finger in ubiquitin-hydrolases [Ditylenchus destructor]